MLSGEYVDQSEVSIDAFVVKYSPTWNVVWQKRFGDVPNDDLPPSHDQATGVETDVEGNVYVNGNFRWTADFDPDVNPGKFVFTADTQAPSPDVFLMRYTPGGDVQWVRAIGGDTTINQSNNDIESWSMKLLGSQVVMSGTITGVADLNPAEDEQQITYMDEGGTGLFYAQYDSEGWYMHSFIVDTVVGVEECSNIAVLEDNSFVTAGRFQRAVDFDPRPNSYTILTTDPDGIAPNFNNDIWFARYGFSGGSSDVEVNISATVAFPNPSDREITIEHPTTAQLREILIYDSNGKQNVCPIRRETMSTTVTTSGLSRGVYTIVLQFADGTIYSSRFVRL